MVGVQASDLVEILKGDLYIWRNRHPSWFLSFRIDPTEGDETSLQIDPVPCQVYDLTKALSQLVCQ